MTAVAVGGGGSSGRGRLDRGKCVLACQLCLLRAARETCLPDLGCSTQMARPGGGRFPKIFGSKASPDKGQPLSGSYAALQKLRAAFKLSVVSQDCSDAVWHCLRVGFGAETSCAQQVVGASSWLVESVH